MAVNATNGINKVTGTAASSASAGTPAFSSVDFSSIMADMAIQKMSGGIALPGAAASSASSMTGISDISSSSDQMSALLSIISSGGEEGASAAHSALLMLIGMMGRDKGSDFSMILTIISDAMSRAGSNTTDGIVRKNIMTSDNDEAVLETVDSSVFKGSGETASTQTVTETSKTGVIPYDAWIPVTPAVSGNEQNRSAQLLKSIISQFEVETNGRYKAYKYGKDTYCNIFLWDVTRALGAEIPHYVDKTTGEPKTYPKITGARELGAISTYDWLQKNGTKYGWTEVTAQQAQEHANNGGPAITAWRNEAGTSGHVQIVCPSNDGTYNSTRGVTVAQAGARNTSYTHITTTYGAAKLSQVKYYIHK